MLIFSRYRSVLSAFLLCVFGSLGVTLGAHSLSDDHRCHLEQHHCCSEDGTPALGDASTHTACVLDIFVGNSFDDLSTSVEVVPPILYQTVSSTVLHSFFVCRFSGLSFALRAPPRG